MEDVQAKILLDLDYDTLIRMCAETYDQPENIIQIVCSKPFFWEQKVLHDLSSEDVSPTIYTETLQTGPVSRYRTSSSSVQRISLVGPWKLFVESCKKGRIIYVSVFLRNPTLGIQFGDGKPISSDLYNGFAIKVASRNKHVKIMELLFEHSSMSKLNQTLLKKELLINAVKENSIEMVEFLIDDPMITLAIKKDAIRLAVENNLIEIVYIILNDPEINTEVMVNEIFRIAVSYKRYAIINYLLENPKLNKVTKERYSHS